MIMDLGLQANSEKLIIPKKIPVKFVLQGVKVGFVFHPFWTE